MLSDPLNGAFDDEELSGKPASHAEFLQNLTQYFTTKKGVIAFTDKNAHNTDPCKPSDITIVDGPKTWATKRMIANEINSIT